MDQQKFELLRKAYVYHGWADQPEEHRYNPPFSQMVQGIDVRAEGLLLEGQLFELLSEMYPALFKQYAQTPEYEASVEALAAATTDKERETIMHQMVCRLKGPLVASIKRQVKANQRARQSYRTT